MGYRIDVDVGGTFTDLALIDEGSGALTIGKVPSVPTDPAVGILQGIQQLLTENGIAPAQVTYLAHGTTVATNTLLQHKGAKTGLITTRGFRDLLEIARQRRPSLYDLRARKPTVLVPAISGSRSPSASGPTGGSASRSTWPRSTGRSQRSRKPASRPSRSVSSTATC